MSPDRFTFRTGDLEFVLQTFIPGVTAPHHFANALPFDNATHLLSNPVTQAAVRLNKESFQAHALLAPDGTRYICSRLHLLPGPVPGGSVVPISLMVQIARIVDPDSRYAPATRYHQDLELFYQRIQSYGYAVKGLDTLLAHIKQPARSVKVARQREYVQDLVDRMLRSGFVTDQTQIDLASRLYMAGICDPFELVKVVSAISNGTSTARDPASAAHETHITISS